MSGVMRRSLGLVLILAALVVGSAQPAHSWTTDGARVAATRAIGAGDGERAARIIADGGLATKPQVLGRMIYEAGIIAVGEGLGDEFSQAVATAFVEGGVSFPTANAAFLHGSLLVLRGAPTDEQLLAEIGPGGLAILRTELAYAGLSLPALSLF